MKYNDIFKRLWIDYNAINPSVTKIHELLKNEGETIINDHIAFRTFDVAGINIDALSSLFLDLGYEECGEYYFEHKKLRARHYEIKGDELAPKVFISELITGSFGHLVKDVARTVADNIEMKKVSTKDLVYVKNIWGPLNYGLYEELLEESEYAAWLYVYGLRANHFTILINYLKKYNTIEKLNQFLISKGFELNTSGGIIKGDKKQMLKQSSTLADIVEVRFIEGVKNIPCCYYEFAERFPDKDNKLFTGFIAKSADKIFDSTDFRK